MEQHVDNAGWATFATVIGMLSVSHELAQYVMAIFTLVSCITVSHFVKRFLNHRFPQKKQDGEDK